MNDSPRKLAYSLRPCDIPRDEAVHYVAEHREDKYLFFARNSGPAGLARVVPSDCYGRHYSDMLITSSVFRFEPIEDWVSAWVATAEEAEKQGIPVEVQLAITAVKHADALLLALKMEGTESCQQ